MMQVNEYSYRMGEQEGSEEGTVGLRKRPCSCCSPRRCCAALGIVAVIVLVIVVAVGGTYGGLASYMMENSDYDIQGLQIEQFEKGNTSWSASLRLTLWCNTTKAGSTLRVSKARVRLHLEGVDMGTIEFGAFTINPDTDNKFSGTLRASKRPLDSVQPVSKYLAGAAINATADIERMTIWCINTRLPHRVRGMSKRIQRL
eukprot:m51a1_g14394 hypothetical protein (201) ;mRNA; f:341421-342098